jgi:hypothetical protein
VGNKQAPDASGLKPLNLPLTRLTVGTDFSHKLDAVMHAV